jgi:4-azaleucine resistance transporter AzlC
MAGMRAFFRATPILPLGNLLPMNQTNLPPSASREIREALFDLAPAMVAAMPIGLLVGATGVSKGMSVIEVVLASGLIFAGGAQLAALQLWTVPLPVGALLFSTLLINSRLILMSASLVPKVRGHSLLGRLVGFYTLADENWALSERRAMQQPLTAAYFVGMGAIFWVNWVFWSWFGAIVGPLIGDPARYGADFAFTAIFIGLIASFTTTSRTAGVVGASAIAAAVAHEVLGSPWHVLVGAFAGLCAAAILWRPESEA